MPWIISPSYVILSSYISFPGSRVTSQIGIFPSLLRNYKIFLSKESHLLSLDNSPSLSFPLLLYPCVLSYCISRIRIVPGCAQVTPISFQKVRLAEFIDRPGSEKNRISLCEGFWNELDIVRVWNQMKRSLSYSKPFWDQRGGEERVSWGRFSD